MAGAWGSFVATSAKYPPAEPEDPNDTSVALPKGVEVAKSSMVKDREGNDVYGLDQNGESIEKESDKVLAQLRLNGVKSKNWAKTLEIWIRTL